MKNKKGKHLELYRVSPDGSLDYKKAGLAILDLLELHWGKLDGHNFDHFINSGLLFLRYLSYHVPLEDKKLIVDHIIEMFEDSPTPTKE
jgi:hypothetical protein